MPAKDLPLLRRDCPTCPGNGRVIWTTEQLGQFEIAEGARELQKRHLVEDHGITEVTL
ncbi:hypothetical protein GCM10020221_14840 [Streptomyces thioluteus]|uniref:Uncharacterized protein n=1 Tax=Streptomyces thioluteus TaxID=66431 RepID=A0ABP6J3I9_STRTU